MKNRGLNKPAQTFSEIVASEKERKEKNRIYRVEAAEFVDEQLSTLINKTANELAVCASSEPVSLKDTAEVRQRTIIYLRGCEEAATFPSILGLSRALGLSRRSLYDVMERQSPPETARWLSMCADAFSDILNEAALRNNCNSILAIFTQKAQYQWREQPIEIVATSTPLIGGEIDDTELQRRILGSVVIDDED